MSPEAGFCFTFHVMPFKMTVYLHVLPFYHFHFPVQQLKLQP